MSLGFLTESALVPSKAKKIKVDAKSLVDLKAVVFQKDQERKRRLQDALLAENDDDTCVRHKAIRFDKYAHLRSGRKRYKQSEKSEVGREYRNAGVEDRSRRDEEAKAHEAPDDDEAWSKLSMEMLRKKTKIYEELANGIGRDRVKGECLVNFEAKNDTVSRGMSTMIEVMDEFGRTRNVAMDSEEYATLQEAQQGFCSEKFRARHLNSTESKDNETKANGGSFVVSQWEKRLKSTEKDYVQEVHEQATRMQSLAAQKLSAGVANKKTRKQLRLERLRKEREEVAMSSESTASANAAVDFAVSEQATDFLEQLSSLM